MKVEIVVPAINLWGRYTKACLESITEAMVRAKAHGKDAHVILIDNNSSDETQAEASKMESELFHYHRNSERWGFQRSVNFGVNYGFEHGADYALVCNNDIVLHPEAIWRLLEGFERHAAGIISCMDVRGEMQERGMLPALIGTIPPADKEKVDVAPNPNFSAFMISKECWETVGEFDELFFPAYFEDNDYHYRMKLMEVPALVYPPAMFYHYGSRTQNEAQENGRPLVYGDLFDNTRAFYAKKWGGTPGSEIYKTPYNEAKTLRDTQQKSYPQPPAN